jgi:hypothetical protein
MNRITAALLAAVLTAAAPALAGGITAATVGTSSAQALAAPTTRGWRLLVIDNESATATIACTLTSQGAAALNSAGSFTILPSATSNPHTVVLGPFSTEFWEGINCIASGASTPVTILAE